ncbi:hypothetical protein ACQBAR_01145 [Propionibacteriaceae bacterium Y1685]
MSSTSSASGRITDPGRTLGIVGFVLAFLAPPIGMILCLRARRLSGALAFDNTLAKAGSLIGLALTVAWAIFLALLILLLVAYNL